MVNKLTIRSTLNFQILKFGPLRKSNLVFKFELFPIQ